MEKARILIVENEATIATEIESHLKNIGHQVTAVVDTGEKAIEKAEIDKPDIVLMDMEIDGKMNGIEASGVIRSRFGIPVIFLTAILDEQRIEWLKINIPFGYLLKPILERDLKVRIETALYVAKVDAERKSAEKALSDSRDRAYQQGKAIARLAVNDDIALGDVPKALQKMMEVIAEIVQVDRAGVWLFSEQLEDLRCATLFEAGENRYSEGMILKVADYPRYFEAIRSSNRVCASDAQTDPQTSEFTESYLKPLGITSMLDAGIHVNGKLVGVICLEHTGEKRSWHPEEESFVSTIATLVAQTLGNAERRQAEDARKASEKQYRELIQFSNSIILMFDPNYTITLMNRFGQEFFGYPEHEIIGRRLIGTIVPATESTGRNLEKMIAEIIKNPMAFVDNENETVCKNGERVWVAWRNVPIYDDNGKLTGILSTGYDITERKQVELAIKKERDLVAAILYWIESIVVVIDLDGYIQKFNKAAENCSGYTLEEVSQKPFWEILILPEERKSVKDVILNAGFISMVSENENYWVTKDGQRRLIHWFNTTLTEPDGKVKYLLCTGLDLTERSQAEKALLRSETHYQAVLENMEEGYFETDRAGTFTTVNKSVEEILGYPKSELIGMDYANFIEPDSLKIVFETYDRIYRTGKSEKYLSYDIIRKDGAKRTLEVSTSVRYDSDGNPIGFHGIARDVTDRKRIEELMIQTEKMMSVGGLAAGMAHELNNPLGGILQGVQNIQRRLSPDLKSNLEAASDTGLDLHNLQRYMEKRGIHSFINGMQESGKKASQIISNMLQFSRKSDSLMAPIYLAELLEKVIELAGNDYDLKKKFDFRNIQIRKEFDANLAPVLCNETEIEQVILNLLSNAAWAMANQKNGELPRIILRLLAKKEMVQIEVEDNGPGIDEGITKRIFEPFFTTKPVGEGTGLGLSVSYMIITNNHHGTMEVKSETGKGTTFIIKLPFTN